jgi:hypothetical protein
MAFWNRIDRGLRGYERLGAILGTTLLVAAPIAAAVFWLRHHTVAAWVPVAVGVPLILFVLLLLGAVLKAPSAAASVGPGDAERLRRLDREIHRSEYGKSLLYDALESVQQALGTDEDWEIDQRLKERPPAREKRAAAG